MTYCVGVAVRDGLVLMSDTRSNAGADDVATVTKMRSWEIPGERFLCLLCAGNLATTQAVTWRLDEAAETGGADSLLEARDTDAAARIVGRLLRSTVRRDGSFGASFLLGGQIGDARPRLHMVYPEGNFVTACEDTPFLQIGEFKYGRPILRSLHDREMSLEQAAKLAALSFETTMRSNLSVGLPIDVQLYADGTLRAGLRRRFGADDRWFTGLADLWPRSLRGAFDAIPDPLAA